MIYASLAAIVAAALITAAVAARCWPKLYCLLNGHIPRCSILDHGVMKWHCDTCKQEVSAGD